MPNANTPTPDSVALPPLPNACYAGVFTPEQMYAYAREAIASLPTPGVPVERVRELSALIRKICEAGGMAGPYMLREWAEELDALAQEGT